MVYCLHPATKGNTVKNNAGNTSFTVALDIDGSEIIEHTYGDSSQDGEQTSGKRSTAIHWISDITTESTAKIKWKADDGNVQNQYGTESTRVFSFIKIT